MNHVKFFHINSPDWWKFYSWCLFEKKIGIFDILFINKTTSLNYEINENNLVFYSEDDKDNFKGFFDFKPFYLSMNVIYVGLSLKNLFNESSILIDDEVALCSHTELVNNWILELYEIVLFLLLSSQGITL